MSLVLPTIRHRLSLPVLSKHLTHHRVTSNKPVLPAFLSRPVKLIPQKIPSSVIVQALNTVLREPLQEGDLDFLKNQRVSVEVSDLNLRFALTLANDQLMSIPWQENDDLNLTGNVYEFLLLASRTEDADTLFFQRRLKMVGSTDLGLEVKNLLDGMEIESIRFHQPIDFMLKKAVSVVEHLF